MSDDDLFVFGKYLLVAGTGFIEDEVEGRDGVTSSLKLYYKPTLPCFLH